MILAGKTSPEYVNITKAVHNGFSNLELYLDDRHLNNLEIVKENIKTAEEQLKRVNRKFRIISVHTPHFENSGRECLEKTLEVAKEYNSYVVLHSRNIRIEDTLSLAREIKSDRILIENKTLMGLKSIAHNLLPYYDMVLDLGHLYRSSQNIYHDLEILMTSFRKRIKLIHLNDATKAQDGLAIGDGDMDFPTIMHILRSTGYSEPLVIDTPQISQLESRHKIEKLMV